MGTQGPARGHPRAFVERERGLAVLAGGQHGVLSRRQLLEAGLSPRTIRRRVEAGRLHPLHRGVYALGRGDVGCRGKWLAAVFAYGSEALLSHRSAAALWGLIDWRAPEVISARGKKRSGIVLHACGVHRDERTIVDGIPVTTLPRTFLDVAEVVDEAALAGMFEEADRRGLLDMRALRAVCARGHGRRGLKPLGRLLDDIRLPANRSPLEGRVLRLCRQYALPRPQTNVTVLGCEVDVFWPDHKLMVEADGFEFHRHRAAFERDRARDAAMQAAGFKVIRLTHRRLKREPAKVAAELRRLLQLGRAAL